MSTDVENNEYIDLQKLQDGTILLIETVNAVYEIEIQKYSGLGKARNAVISGGTSFVHPTNCELLGSFRTDIQDIQVLVEPDLSRYAGMIKKGLCIEIRYLSAPRAKKHSIIATAPVVSCMITAPDKSWHYEMWEN